MMDGILRDAVQRYKGKSWKKIGKLAEDNMLIELVGKQGKKKWSEIGEHLPGRMGKQCRERWFNHLNPEIKKYAWTKEEEMILIESHAIYRNKWSEIAKLLPGSFHGNDEDKGLAGLLDESKGYYCFLCKAYCSDGAV